MKPKKFFQIFLPFQKFEIQTALPKAEIVRRVRDFADPEYTGYYGKTSDDGFWIAEPCIKHSGFGSSRNSFAPVATAKISETDGISTVKVIVRMRLLVMLIAIPIYLISILTLVLFPFMFLLMYFAFVRPADKLKKELEVLLSENPIYD
jgi:hypothetical protein